MPVESQYAILKIRSNNDLKVIWIDEKDEAIRLAKLANAVANSLGITMFVYRAVSWNSDGIWRSLTGDSLYHPEWEKNRA